MRKLNIRYRQALCLLLALAVALCFSATLSTESVHASGNKALKAEIHLSGITYEDYAKLPAEEQVKANEDIGYSVGILFKKKLKLTKNMKVSGKVYIPKELLAEPGTSFAVFPLLVYEDKDSKEGIQEVYAKYVATVANNKGKVQVQLFNQKNSVKKGKKVKLSKKGKYYVLKLKNIPLESKTLDQKAIDTKHKRNVSLIFSTGGYGHEYTGPIYFDSFILKAKKTTGTSFSKKNYKDAFGFHSTNFNKKIKVSRAKIK